ncbi:MAG: metallophosphoesterase, partial [Chitinophagaceae bacterium]|nr:metallophosphoesterase [Chitinophagaceae bacterium]
VITHPPPDARGRDGIQLISTIKDLLLRLKDGPYVFYENKSTKAYTINGGDLVQQELSAGSTVVTATDRNDKFQKVELQQKLSVPPVDYPRPEKLFVLSDIEGNFAAFRKLLQANRIIDENFNWTFSDGHLVFAGDMFDRGEQVTECLWLIYSLEEKAKASGGYVHFVLGNHEIMNLQGDDKYVKQKYKNNATLLGKTIKELYNDDSELGRWLRSKNIMEKIGDMLIIHGGISGELNRLSLTISQINETARPYYAEKKRDFANKDLNTIMSKSNGPFWYRGYYYLNRSFAATPKQVDSTLQKFNVKHIITGHTIIADTISTHYNGKVINTDTHHAEGKSEALLIEGDHYYRVNQEGKRVLLFIDEKKKTSPSAQ